MMIAYGAPCERVETTEILDSSESGRANTCSMSAVWNRKTMRIS